MKKYEGGEVQHHIFFISALYRGEWPVSRSGCFISGGVSPVNEWIRRFVDLKSLFGYCGEERNVFPRLEFNPDSAAIQPKAYSLYRPISVIHWLKLFHCLLIVTLQHGDCYMYRLI
jgi:hypothetical protein